MEQKLNQYRSLDLPINCESDSIDESGSVAEKTREILFFIHKAKIELLKLNKKKH